jgi:ribosomal protein L32
MRTRTSPLTSVSRARARGPSNPLIWNRLKTTFVSICPNCGQARAQHAYTRRALFVLLNTRRKIDAYCTACKVCWPISEGERRAIEPP